MPHPPLLRAAILGCGQIAGGYDMGGPPEMVRTHARAYAESDEAELVAVMDTVAERAGAFARHWQVPRVYGSLADLLQAEKPDLVSICTPDAHHAEDVRACLECSSVKGIWCEKPLALEVGEATKLVEWARERRVVLAVNYQRQWETSHRRLAQEIHGGDWGGILGGHGVYAKGIFHNGSHLITLLRGLLGEPEEMKAHRAFYDYSPDDPTVDGTIFFQGAPVQLLGLPIMRHAVFELSLFFEAGLIRIIHSGKKIVRQRVSQTGYPHLLDEEIEQTGIDRVLSTVLGEITQAVRTGSSVIVDGKSALRTLEICSRLSRQASLL